MTVTRPATAALLPALARSPEELTAANVASGWIESISVLLSPALAGVLLGAGGGAGSVFAVMAGVAVVACLLVAGVRGPGPAGAAADTRDAVRAAAEPGPRALLWLLGVEAVAIGALDVLCVVLAIGVLHPGGGTAAYLNAAFGAGGVVGVAATVALVGRRRLAPALLGSLLLWSAAFAALAVAPSLGVALACSWSRASPARCSTSPDGRCCSGSRGATRRRASSACSSGSR